MYFEQFYLVCLAQASYMIGSDGIAAVVDPQRDIDIYLEAAREHHVRIAHIFETHLHADFVSGHRELAERTGATIYIGAAANARFPHVPLCDGFELQFGQCTVRALDTPGHTPESTCLVLFDAEQGSDPVAVLTGDTLFIGDVGRPDLSPTHTPQQLAAMLYDSVHKKLLALPDSTKVYPAHGAGSLCGRNMSAERQSTIGNERKFNYALQIGSRDEFVQALTTNLPARPAYFLQDAAINREGASSLDHLPEVAALDCDDLIEFEDRGAFVLDTRSAEQYAAGHLPGSVCIPLSGQFASWAGAIIGLSTPVILVAESDEKMHESRTRLARVGIESVIGYLKDGIEGWQRAGFPLEALPQITTPELNDRLKREQLTVLDVRREPEWQAGHIAGAHWHPLDEFARDFPLLDRHAPVVVHCKSGYRSTIAAGLLQRAGFTNLMNLTGGFDAWTAANLPVAIKEEEAVRKAA